MLGDHPSVAVAEWRCVVCDFVASLVIGDEIAFRAAISCEARRLRKVAPEQDWFGLPWEYGGG